MLNHLTLFVYYRHLDVDSFGYRERDTLFPIDF
jgi:hypothetical protein